MSVLKVIERYLARVPYGAAVSYVGLVLVFVIVTLTSIMDVFDRQEAVAEAADTLSRMEGRAPRGAPGGDTTGASGSPQLEGPTVTVAGATLLQRVAGAITKVGGNIVSSQVELQGPQIKDGFISVTANCEVEQPALQQLLYNLESGMPFLFIDQLVVQSPSVAGAFGASSAPGAPGGKMRVLISVSGQWQATK
jgi:general secretion pathway protein M